jgi:uncharacterized protein (TIGR02001 family)
MAAPVNRTFTIIIEVPRQHKGIEMVRIAAVLFLLSSTAVYAGDESTSQENIQSKFDVAFGASIVSNYIFRGVTQSDDKAAFQAYAEASYGIFYAGLWGSTVDFGDDNKGEIDISAGIRPEFGDFAFDLGYVRYLYTADGDCCGEGYAKADYSFSENFGAGLEVFRDFNAKTTYMRAHASLALPADFEISGGVGAYAGFDQQDWDFGVSKTFADFVKVDVRYHGYDDAVETTHKFMVGLSLDTALSALSGE